MRGCLRRDRRLPLVCAIAEWIGDVPTATVLAPGIDRRTIAVDRMVLRGSRTTDTAAWHVPGACDQYACVLLASTDVDGHTSEMTNFGRCLTTWATCATPQRSPRRKSSG